VVASFVMVVNCYCRAICKHDAFLYTSTTVWTSRAWQHAFHRQWLSLANYSHGNFQAAEIHIPFHITLEQESQEMQKNLMELLIGSLLSEKAQKMTAILKYMIFEHKQYTFWRDIFTGKKRNFKTMEDTLQSNTKIIKLFYYHLTSQTILIIFTEYSHLGLFTYQKYTLTGCISLNFCINSHNATNWQAIWINFK